MRDGIPPYTRVVRSHEWIDRRSLALHETVAAKLEANPELLEVARTNLSRWLQGEPVGALREWANLLRRPPGEIVVLLRSTDEDATRLRQSSPFAGVLTPEERLRILRWYDPRRP